MTKDEAKKILLETLPKLNCVEQEALKVLLEENESANLRVEVIDATHQKFNGEVYIKRESTGYYAIWKTLHKEVMRHHTGGEIPKNYVVHHKQKDENGNWDKNKNNIEDLILLPKEEHLKIHEGDRKVIKPKVAICTVCGKEFMSKYRGGRHRPFLCSKKCRNIWNASQIEERTCVICGKTFSVCKYKKIQCCSRSCGNVLGHRNREKN